MLAISSNRWLFPSTTISRNLITLWAKIQAEIQPEPSFSDEIVWTLEEHENFSLKSAYAMILNLESRATIPCSDYVWLKGYIKKIFVCAWMGLLGCLKTKSFLISRNINCDSNCVFCPSTWEN